MSKLLKGLTCLTSKILTFNGAAAFDLSETDPLKHLVFTKGSALFSPAFYHTQVQEIFEYSKALLIAEQAEPGFAWKFAAYMRDPKNGKGNRIQGTVAPAILSAAAAESEFVEEYVYKCLCHRADDLVKFVTHFVNLDLGAIPEPAKKGMARAANQFDEYQLLKYARKQYPVLKRRKNGRRASLRLVDALGICKKYLNCDTLLIYQYLHAPARKQRQIAAGMKLVPHRKSFYDSGYIEDAIAGRISFEQMKSTRKFDRHEWQEIFDNSGLLSDIAFFRYVRSLYLNDGVELSQLRDEASKRAFKGLWPHQVYSAYRTVVDGIHRVSPYRSASSNYRIVYRQAGVKDLDIVFDTILDRISNDLLPEGLNLGIADISGSMYSVPLGGEHSSCSVGQAAIVFASMMSRELGYAATFDDSMQVLQRPNCFKSSDLNFADYIQKSGAGWGSTQVAGSIVSFIDQLLKNPKIKRPQTLYFFSDMQFDPPDAPTSFNYWSQPGCFQNHIMGFSRRIKNQDILKNEKLVNYLKPNKPPLVAALDAYRELIGSVDVVLWNMAAYNASPMPSTVDNVLLVSGFDANTFKHINDWKKSGVVSSASTKNDSVHKVKDDQVVLDQIRLF